MASVSNRRITAIILQSKLNALFAAVQPLYAQAAPWNVSGIDDNLPPEGEVKAVLDGYTALAIPGLNTREALQDVALSTDTFSGVFAVPSTAFPIQFPFSGPVYAPMEQSQGFGVALTLHRATLFIGYSGATGADVQIDALLGGDSIFSAPITVPVGSGSNLIVTIPDSQLITTSVPAGSILTARIVAAPDDYANNVNLYLWATS